MRYGGRDTGQLVTLCHQREINTAAHLNPFVQSGTLAHSMGPPTFKVCLHTSINPAQRLAQKHAVSMVILNAIKLAVEIKQCACFIIYY